MREVAGSRGAAGGQQGGDLTDHGRSCFVGYQPLTDGICDDVLDVVEGIAGKTGVIELTQEEQGIKEVYDSEKKKCIRKKESERCDTSGY